MTRERAIAVPRGFRASVARAGIKPSGALDLALFASETPCAAVGMLTTNRIAAAPVRWCRDRLPAADIRAIVANSGNANAATGAQGEANVQRTAEQAARLLGCLPSQILLASTGVIGRQLPMELLEPALETAAGGLSNDPIQFERAAEAIMTTDTRAKIVSTRHESPEGSWSILGICKGAAMIGPSMATMLAFLLTDAPVWADDLQPIVEEAVDRSFHCLSVEGHTSTNDTVLALSSTAGSEPILEGDQLSVFSAEVRSVCASLARLIADDGEGATHLIVIDVEGCGDDEEARVIARAIANSPLVKTAIHGCDPNWGRIVSAAGYAGVSFDEHELSLWIDGVAVFQNGAPVEHDPSELTARLRSQREVTIQLRLARGNGGIRFWTCDLTSEYVRLNAEYTT
jgi:glutamate N-acetyltransferase/amino-acid N-acetyltransferase